MQVIFVGVLGNLCVVHDDQMRYVEQSHYLIKNRISNLFARYVDYLRTLHEYARAECWELLFRSIFFIIFELFV